MRGWAGRAPRAGLPLPAGLWTKAGPPFRTRPPPVHSASAKPSSEGGFEPRPDHRAQAPASGAVGPHSRCALILCPVPGLVPENRGCQISGCGWQRGRHGLESFARKKWILLIWGRKGREG